MPLAPRRAAKASLRRQLEADRRTRRMHAITGGNDEAGEALAARILALPELARAPVVAAYASVGTEPPTDVLRERLRHRGTDVLLPVLLDDGDLEWALDDGRLRFAGRGLQEPAGARLGREAVRTAQAVVVPGLAVGGDGTRLGRGGGSYDRALARLPAHVPTVLLLWDGELLDDVPREDHDRPVSIVVTPTAVRRFGPKGPP